MAHESHDFQDEPAVVAERNWVLRSASALALFGAGASLMFIAYGWSNDNEKDRAMTNSIPSSSAPTEPEASITPLKMPTVGMSPNSIVTQSASPMASITPKFTIQPASGELHQDSQERELRLPDGWTYFGAGLGLGISVEVAQAFARQRQQAQFKGRHSEADESFEKHYYWNQDQLPDFDDIVEKSLPELKKQRRFKFPD